MICIRVKRKNGFSIIEFLAVFAILLIIFVISATVFITLQGKSNLDNNNQQMIGLLRLARQKTLSSESASRYGVYFDDTVSPNQYTLFKGSSFTLRDPAFDDVHNLSKNIEIYEIDLSGGKEVIFSRITGEAFPSGNLKTRITESPSETAVVYIDNSGRVDTALSASPSADNLVKDSRHVHFDLGWSIQSATVLKFYFPAFGQTQTISMADYFNLLKTEFDWSGTFPVGGADQDFQVHTHLIDPLTHPYTRLCIHRDRNNGKNNQEVIIYVVDGGIDKEIVHYLNDAQSTVIQGLYTESFEIQ